MVAHFEGEHGRELDRATIRADHLLTVKGLVYIVSFPVHAERRRDWLAGRIAGREYADRDIYEIYTGHQYFVFAAGPRNVIKIGGLIKIKYRKPDIIIIFYIIVQLIDTI